MPSVEIVFGGFYCSRKGVLQNGMIRCLLFNSLHAQSPEPPLLETTKAPALQFTIYPNPLNQGPLYIQCSSPSPKEVILYNVMGETVFQAYTQENTFDLSYLNTGIYLIRVTQDEKTGVQRLVIP